MCLEENFLPLRGARGGAGCAGVWAVITRENARFTSSWLPRIWGSIVGLPPLPYPLLVYLLYHTGTSRIVFFAGKIKIKRAFFAPSYFSEEVFWANFSEPDTDRLEYWRAR